MEVYLILSIIIGLVVVALLVWFIVDPKKRKEAFKPNFRTFFIIGMIWLPAGIAMNNLALWGLGLVFLIAGLVNRNKWKEERKWSDLSPSEKRIKIVLLMVVSLLVLITLGVYLWPRS